MIPTRWNLNTKANRCCSESRHWIMAHCIFCHSNLTNEQASYQCSNQPAEMPAHLRLCLVSALCSWGFCLAHCYPALDSPSSVRCTSSANVLIKWRCSLKSWSGILTLCFYIDIIKWNPRYDLPVMTVCVVTTTAFSVWAPVCACLLLLSLLVLLLLLLLLSLLSIHPSIF